MGREGIKNDDDLLSSLAGKLQAEQMHANVLLHT